MTFREIQSALRAISKRRDQAARFEAALHGVKLEPLLNTGSDAERSEVSSEKQAMMDQTMRALMEQRRMEKRARG